MAIYSLHVSNVSRAAGSSAVASCSYITSRRMRDERTGEAFNGFGRRERVEHVCTMLPEGAPGEYLDPERLFNAVEMAEKRSDARPAKKIMVALPREFDARERFRALEDFISWNITANGYACTYAIHTDKDGRNPHAHILVANRRIDPKTGRWAAKSRSEFALDANGRRIPVIDPDTGRQKIGARNRKVWKRVNVSNNPRPRKKPQGRSSKAGVASDVIGYPITRFAVRIGLPGRPVPHGRLRLQTARAACATTVFHLCDRGVTLVSTLLWRCCFGDLRAAARA